MQCTIGGHCTCSTIFLLRPLCNKTTLWIRPPFSVTILFLLNILVSLWSALPKLRPNFVCPYYASYRFDGILSKTVNSKFNHFSEMQKPWTESLNQFTVHPTDDFLSIYINNVCMYMYLQFQLYQLCVFTICSVTPYHFLHGCCGKCT